MSKKRLNSLNQLNDLVSTRVYSTETGQHCKECGQPMPDCVCHDEHIPEGDGIVRLRRETKGRKGKGVTLVEGVLKTPSDLKVFAKELKTLCGTGGTVKSGVIEIQGDVRDKLQGYLIEKGYQVKKVGG